MDFWNKVYYQNTIGDWAISLAIILGGILVAKLMYMLIGKFVKSMTSKTKTELDDILVDKLEEPLVYGFATGCAWYAVDRLSFSAKGHDAIGLIFYFIIIFLVTWFLARFVDALIAQYLKPVVEKSDSDLDDQLMPIVQKGVKWIIWTLGIIVGMNNAGFDVAALIAGLGIGGLALALAAQDTVKNIFGGIMIFVDKPFRMGDRIKVNGFDGIVEEIGLRTTRIRTLDGRLVTTPNSTFSDQSIENVSAEPARRVVLKLGLTYDTSSERIEEAIEILMNILNEHQEVLTPDTWTLFDTYGDFSLGINYVYWIKKEQDIPTIQTKINLEILKRFNAAGLEFAFPTQTIYKKELK